MSDKRFYKRVTIEKPGIIFYKCNEYNCIIKDISENGIGFLITDKITENELKVKERIKFNFIDKFKFLNSEDKEYIISGEAIIKRIIYNNNGTILGCLLSYDENLDKYVIDKKSTNYLNNGYY